MRVVTAIGSCFMLVVMFVLPARPAAASQPRWPYSHHRQGSVLLAVFVVLLPTPVSVTAVPQG
jgi:hypothetical protein